MINTKKILNNPFYTDTPDRPDRSSRCLYRYRGIIDTRSELQKPQIQTSQMFEGPCINTRLILSSSKQELVPNQTDEHSQPSGQSNFKCSIPRPNFNLLTARNLVNLTRGLGQSNSARRIVTPCQAKYLEVDRPTCSSNH